MKTITKNVFRVLIILSFLHFFSPPILAQYNIGGSSEATGNITNDDEACNGETVTIAAGIIGGTETYTWSDGSIGDNQTFNRTFTSNATFTVTITDAPNPSVVQVINVLNNALPNPNITASETTGTANDGIVCSGDNVTLDSNIAGATAYAWSAGGGTNQTAAYTNVTSNSVYTVTVTNSDGCTGTDSYEVTVDTPTGVTVTFDEDIGTSNDGNVCANGSSQVGIVAPAGFANYAWSMPMGNVESFNVSIGGGATQVFTVTVTNATGCTATAENTLTINALPTATTMALPTSVCVGDASTLTASGGASYSWSTGDMTSTASVSPTANEIFTVTVTSAAGCIDTETVGVTVNALPTATTIALSTSVCVGDASTLTASGGASYSWSTGDMTSTASVSPTANEIFTVTVTSAAGCIDTETVGVTVNALPTATTIALPTSVCVGDASTLTASGGASYSWSTGDMTSTASVSPTTTEVFTVTITNTTGCTDTETVGVTVNALPTATTMTLPTSVCIGGASTLTASGGASYSWSTGDMTSTASVSPTANEVFTVTVTSAAGCIDTETVGVTVNALPTATTMALPTSVCVGDASTLTASGGASYSWSTGDMTSTASISPTANEVFTVTVTSAAGCIDTETVGVTVNALPTATTMTLPTSVCIGGASTLTASGGASYSWSTGDMTSTASVSPTANEVFTVTVTSAAGCIDTETVGVTVNALPTATTMALPTSVCIGDASTLTASGGASYSWSTGDMTSTASVSPTADEVFTVTVTSAAGCIDTETVGVTVNALPTATTMALPTSVCVGDASTLTASGGASYSWSTGDMTSTASVSPTANEVFTVTVTSAAGCIDTETVGVTVNALPTATTMALPTSVCVGDASTLTASGGASYSWSTGDMTSTASVSPTANEVFTVTVTSAAGCIDTETVGVTVNALPTATTMALPTSVCVGDASTLTASGGASYSWSTGDMTSTASVSPTANEVFTVTVTSAAGCIDTETVGVTVNALPTATTMALPTSVCVGDASTLTASGGASYSWSTGDMTSTASVSPTANAVFTVTVTSAAGCIDTETVGVTVNALPTATTIALPTSVCVGDASTLTASGGASYSWSTGDMTSTASVSPTANEIFTVTVTSAAGCIDTETVGVTVNALPTISALALNNNYCDDGTNNFTVTFTTDAADGSSYVWSEGLGVPGLMSGIVTSGGPQFPNPITTATNGGVYTVTVTSADGCTATSTVEASINPLPTATTMALPTSVCVGDASTLTASGGASYSWSTGDMTSTASVSPTTNEVFTVTVTNADGCTDTETVGVTVNALPTISALALNNDYCDDGTNNFTVTFTTDAADGSSYVWSEGLTVPGLMSGIVTSGGPQFPNPITTAVNGSIYTVTVTLSSGCTEISTVEASINPLPTAMTMAMPTSVCVGDASTLTASGGASYEWSTGDMTATVLVSATVNEVFTVTVTSADGCTDTETVGVTANALPTAMTMGVPTAVCPGDASTLTASGGASYSWSTGEMTATVSVSPTANEVFTVTVTSGSGCTDIETVGVTVNGLPTAMTMATPTSVCVGDASTLTASGGASYEWSTGDMTATVSVSATANEVFTVTVTSGSGCTDIETVGVTVNGLPTAMTMAMPTSVCVGDASTLTASGGASYEWSTGDMTATVSVSATANEVFTVTVTSGSGCTDIETVGVTVNGLPTAMTMGVPTAVCPGDASTLTASGGASYSWSTGEMTATVSVSPTANEVFTVTVTSGSGCTDIETVGVTVNGLPTAMTMATPTSVCVGDASTLTASGGASYEWSTGDMTATVSVSATANEVFTVTVTSGSGCTDIETVGVTVNGLPTAMTMAMPTSVCVGDASTLTASGGASYEWSTGDMTATVSVSATANEVFTVTVTSGSGCTDIETVGVTVNGLPTAMTMAMPTSVCVGDASTLTASGGASYSWSTGEMTATVSVSPTANEVFTVTVTSGSGCTDIETVGVTVNGLPTAMTMATPTSVCVGDASTLTASGGASYEWSTGDMTATVLVSATVNEVFTVTVTSADGCTDTETVGVTANALPTAMTMGVPTAVCPGDASTLTASGGASYSWSTGEMTATVSVSPTANEVFTVTVTSGSGCTDIETVGVTVNGLPTAMTMATPTSVCVGDASTLTASGGASYEWSTGDMTATVSVSATANEVFTVTVTSGSGCTDIETVGVTVNGLPTAMTMAMPTSVCVGDASTLTASGGASYEWSTGDMTATVSVSATANEVFTVTVTSGSGCTDIETVGVTVNGLPTAMTMAMPTSVCVGDASTLTASGGASYSWSTGEMTATVSVSPTANEVFTVTVTSGSGCTDIETVGVTVNGLPTAMTMATPTSVCVGDASTLTASGGASYEWSTGDMTATVSVSATANEVFTVTVTSGSGCTDIETVGVTVNGLPTAMTMAMPTSVCVGDASTLTASGGASYEWSTGDMTATVSVSATANEVFTVTVTSADGCTDTETVGVTANALPTAMTMGVPTAVCPGDASTLTASGGASYEWSTGDMTATVSVSPTANEVFTVTVTSADGCTDTETVGVTVNGLPTAMTMAMPSAICVGDASTLTASGGASYEWSTGEMTATVSVSPTANEVFTVTVTNGSGCTDIETVGVTVNGLPTAMTMAMPTSVCVGDASTLTASGGASYEWSTGDMTATVSVSATANEVFTVTVTSADGCTDTETVGVTANALPTAMTMGVPTAVCPGDASTLTASGGASYEWSTGDMTATVSVSPTANEVFTVTVTSADGCTDTETVGVIVNGLPTAMTMAMPTSVCVGDASTLTASGGASYSWSTGDMTATVSVSPTANEVFTVTVTSGSGCTDIETVGVTVNGLPTAMTMAIPTSVCVGDASTLTASGGASYEWSTGDMTATVSVSATANEVFTVTVTSADGCTDTETVGVTANALPTAMTMGVPTAVCPGDASTLTASGGASYEWSTGDMTAIASVSPTANEVFTVTVTSADGCTDTETVGVIVNGLPTAMTMAMPSAICVGDASTLTASGGASYSWSTGDMTATVSVSPTANEVFTVTVTSGSGCTDIETVGVIVNGLPTAMTMAMPTSVCVGDASTLTASGGASYEWSTGNMTATVSVSPTANEVFTVTVTSADGCTDTETVGVTANALPTAMTMGVPTAVCLGDASTLTASGGASYEWSTGDMTATVSVSPTANEVFTVTVTSADGCTDTETVGVIVNGLPTAMTMAMPSAICVGDASTLTASGGASYSWSTGEMTATVSVSPTANEVFTVTVTNGAGCTDIETVGVIVNGLPTAMTIAMPTSVCVGDALTLTASGGASYEWSTGNMTATVSVSPTANEVFTVTVTSADGCTDTETVGVTANALPTAMTMGVPTAVCPGDASTLTASGGASYEWSTGDMTATVSVSPTANEVFTVTVTSADGCTDTETVGVTVNGLPTAMTMAMPSAICVGDASTLTASGGASYEWSTGDMTAIASVSPTANEVFTVTVTNGAGCTDIETVGVTVNGLPTAMTMAMPTSVCVGDPSTLTASGGASYEWSTGNMTATVSVSPTANEVFTVTVTSADGCTDTETVGVTANALPTAMTMGVPTAVCPGDASTLTASGGASYEWSTGDMTATVSVSPTANEVFTVTVTSADGCTDTETVGVIVNGLPTAMTMAMPSAICVGDASTLTASGGASYEWSTGEMTATVSVSPTANEVFTVTVTNGAGCTDIETVGVIVNGLPTAMTMAMPTSVCVGDASTLTASGGASYEWSTGNMTATVSVSPTANEVFTVTVTSADGCTDTETVGVTANALPTAMTMGVPTAVCPGDASTLTASGGASYEWSTGDMTATVSVSPTANEVFTVTVTSADGCTDTETVGVIVNGLPTAMTMAMPSAICVGDASTLTASGGASYEWSTGEMTATVSVSPTANEVFTVTVTNGAGCTDIETVGVIVNGLPTAMTMAMPTSVCVGDASTLTASGGASYEWSTGNMTATVSVSPTANEVFTVTVISADGCTDTETVGVTANALPTAMTMGVPTAVCPGDASTLTASGGASYEWSTGDMTATVSVSPTANEVFTVTVTSADGCTDTETVGVTVNGLPTAMTMAMPSAICVGDASTLTASGGASYEWSTGDMTAIASVSPTANEVFTVTVTNGAGCTDIETVGVIVNGLPTASISSNAAICAGENLNLQEIGTGGIEWLWSGPNLFTSTLQNPTINSATTAATGTYWVTVINAEGCSNNSSMSATVNPTPIPTITGTFGFCLGRMATLDAGTYADMPNTYNWSNGESSQLINTSIGGIYTVTVTNNSACTGTASVEVSSAPCLAEAGTVTTNSTSVCPGDALTISVAGENQTANYTQQYFVYTEDNLGNTTYVTNNTTGIFNGLASGDYLICAYNECTDCSPSPSPLMTNLDNINDTGTTQGGCFDVDCESVTVPEGFDPIEGSVSTFVTSTGTNVFVVEVCGGVQPYDEDLTSSGGFASLQEYPGDTPGCIKYQITYATSVDWTLNITDSNGCSGSNGQGGLIYTSDGVQTTPQPQIFDVSTTPEKCPGDKNGAIEIKVDYGENDCGEYTAVWTGSGGYSETVVFNTTTLPATTGVSGLGAGSYNVVVTDCDGTTITTDVNVTRSGNSGGGGRGGRGSRGCKTALEEILGEMEVLPNPFNHTTTIAYSLLEGSFIELVVYTMDGRLVANLFKGQVEAGTKHRTDFDASGLPTGMYILQLRTDSGVVHHEQLSLMK